MQPKVVIPTASAKERKSVKEKMKNVVLQNPKVRAVFKRLKDK